MTKEGKEENNKKIMDRINRGRKKEQKNDYKKSEKIQNYANELEKVMFCQKSD